ncbi:DUF362 domain-containing protein [Desulfuromonas carbonis]|uniref:DUF362 domain-containing protein n=1 Tax=Desulfuromonas sp. DDH964 TaxID=1823759 RepID=UPI00078C60A3|nr:DUF362 domain-containing protein [Desulfuromonas sp. DDH964]AMV72855.1 (4Fe-4S)-binding protein [Desulfuromonas sp. DDH964]
MKPAVSLQALADYRPPAVSAALAQLLAPLGGIATFVRPGQKVLLKPNMLAGKAPEKAVTTHPEILRAVIRAVRAAGGLVSVGDSPGVGSPEQVARRCGLLQVIEEEGARFAPFSESVRVRVGQGTFHELELARDVLDAEVIINLPKLKTHQMMGLTCGVKNLFGAVVGMRKVRLHLQAGTDKAFFALMLLELAEQIAPALTIVDAVVAMEGDGPGSGDPVLVGALLAGANPLAVDTVAAALLGLGPKVNWTQKVASQSGREGSDLAGVDIFGAVLEELQVSQFRPARTTDVNFGLPAFIRRPLKNALTARPSPDHTKCVRCGLCVEHCPPQAMQITDEALEIDYARCIRCFCCQELCPHGALLTEQGLLLRLTRYLNGRN